MLEKFGNQALRSPHYPGCPSSEGLRLLHREHSFAIAFENIEPFLGRPVSLEPEALAQKILRQRRGGYCFELNSFFFQTIRAQGFTARPALGRVFMGRPAAGPRTHLVNIVSLDGREYLADVGFGGPGLLEPIPFEPGFECVQGGHRVRLRADAEWGMVYEDFFEGAWRAVYAIAHERTEQVDLKTGNHYCATHPESIFVNSLYCARPLPGEKRITVFNRSVHILHRYEKMEERTLREEEDIFWLCEQLGIELPASDLRAIAKKLPN